MTERNNLPENDPDLILAKEYSRIAAGEKSVADFSDLLLDILFKARNEEERIEAGIPVRGQESGWNRIQESISQNNKKRNLNVLQLPFQKRWLWTAAAIALIAFSSLLLLQQTVETTPQLIAESGSTLSIIELTDGSSVTLRPNSKLYEISLTDYEHTYSLTGEALFDVESSRNRAFSVEAGAGRVIVTGTRFNLRDRDQKSSIHLLEGEVIFEATDRDQSVHLSPGEAAVIDEQDQLLHSFSFEPDEVTGWTQSRLTFRDREAESIFTELEFHFNINIKAPAETRQEILGGSIPLESAEQSLEDLGTVLGGRFVQIGESIYQFRPDQ